MGVGVSDYEEKVSIRRWVTCERKQSIPVCKKCGHCDTHYHGCLYAGCDCNSGGGSSESPHVVRTSFSAWCLADDPSHIELIRERIDDLRVALDCAMASHAVGSRYHMPIRYADVRQILLDFHYLLDGNGVGDGGWRE